MLERDYYTLSQAAVLLGCSVDDVIHQGVKGKLDIHILLANWNVKGVKRVSGHHIEFDMVHGPLTKKLNRNCLAKFEANQETAEVMLAREFIYTYNYRDPLAAHGEFWEHDKQTNLWRYCIGDTIFLLRRPSEIYVSGTEPVAVLKRCVEDGFGFPAPIKLNECAMVVMAEDLKRLQATQIDGRVSDTDYKQTTSEIEPSDDFSLLFKDIKRKDDWYQVMFDIAKNFYNEHGMLPNEVAALSILTSKEQNGYQISVGNDRGEDCLEMEACKSLPVSSFKKRWRKYTNDSGK